MKPKTKPNPLISKKALYLENLSVAGNHVYDCKTNPAGRQEPCGNTNSFLAAGSLNGDGNNVRHSWSSELIFLITETAERIYEVPEGS